MKKTRTRALALALALMLMFSMLTAALSEGEVWTCPECGREGNAENFCPSCGTPRPVVLWTCPNCGREGNDDRFCPNCGSPRPEAQTEAAATAEPQPEPAPEEPQEEAISEEEALARGAAAYDEQDWETALYYLKPLADAGNAVAQWRTGDLFLNGFGVEQFDELAYEYYLRSAEQGNAEAQCRMGYMYYAGRAVEQDYETAVQYYRMSAEQGCCEALRRLGLMYRDGDGVEQSYETAAELFRTAAELGDEKAQSILNEMIEEGQIADGSEPEPEPEPEPASDESPLERGRAAYEEEDWETAMRLLKPLADEGDAGAQWRVGRMFWYGYGTEEDDEAAEAYFKLSADQLNTGGLYYLAMFYQGDRSGTPRDKGMAIYCLYMCLRFGGNVAPTVFKLDISDPAEQLEHDCMYGPPSAGSNPDAASEDPAFKQGVEAYRAEDYETAMEILKPLADSGSAAAQVRVADMFYYGYGRDKNVELAAAYYALSAEQGNAGAQHQYGVCLLNGYGVEKDTAKALEQFRLAARQGYWASMNMIADMYEEGNGVPQDSDMAVQYLYLSLKHGGYIWIGFYSPEVRDAAVRRFADDLNEFGAEALDMMNVPVTLPEAASTSASTSSFPSLTDALAPMAEPTASPTDTPAPTAEPTPEPVETPAPAPEYDIPDLLEYLPEFLVEHRESHQDEGNYYSAFTSCGYVYPDPFYDVSAYLEAFESPEYDFVLVNTVDEDYTSTGGSLYTAYNYKYVGPKGVSRIYVGDKKKSPPVYNLQVLVNRQYVEDHIGVSIYYAPELTYPGLAGAPAPGSADDQGGGSETPDYHSDSRNSCTRCNGRKKIECDRCDGRGTYTHYELGQSVEVTCDKCNGSKTITCPDCHGTGYR